MSEEPTHQEDPTTVESESFAALLDASEAPQTWLSPGQKINGTVISVQPDYVYIDLGGKREGLIKAEEFVNGSGEISVAEGDEIEVYFVANRDSNMMFTTRISGRSAASLAILENAHKEAQPLDGEVRKEVKGGFSVSLSGVDAFCPASQIDLRPGGSPKAHIGQAYKFKIIRYEERGRNIVVSRRVLLEEEQARRIEELKSELKEGQEIKGTVKSLQNFGAFVDIGGVDALIPTSELSWDRVGHPKSVLDVGDEITARIISLDWENNRLTLSLKAMTSDPWLTADERYEEGDKVEGTVARLAPFGAFVSLEPAVDGLIHISNLGAGRRINHPKEVVEVGQTVEVYVEKVDTANRRISLIMEPKKERVPVELPPVGAQFSGVVERVMPYGIFVRISPELSGLVPNEELGTAKGANHEEMFPVESSMDVTVIRVDHEKGLVRLSRKARLDRQERDEYREYMSTATSSNDSDERNGVGSLGAILKAKLEEKEAAQKD